MGNQSYLIRRGGAYSARMRVPSDLVDKMGRSELVKALGTKDREVAKRRVLVVVQSWQATFDALRSREPLAEERRIDLVAAHYFDTLERDDLMRASIPTDADIEIATERVVERVQRENIDLSDPLKALDAALEIMVMKNLQAGSESYDAFSRRTKLAELRKHLAKGESALVQHKIDAYLETHGTSSTLDSFEYRAVVRELIRAEIEALQRTLERDEGNYGGSPADQLIKRVTEQHSAAGGRDQAIMAVYEQFAGEYGNRVTPDRINQMRRDVGILVPMVGPNFPVSGIDKKVVREWKALLIHYPIRATEQVEFRDLPIKEAVAQNKKSGKKVISDLTVNRYLSSLGSFCKWAVNNGYLEANPVTGMLLSKPRESKKLPFSTDQLNILFRSPMFTGCQSESVWSLVARPGNIQIRDHRYWTPMIMLFSGARPGEIGQLAVSDIRQEHGRWIMHITTEGDGNKRTKTKGSMRVVPLHPMLLRLGFLEYHQSQAKTRTKSLFPKAVRNERGQMMAEFSREFGKYLKRIGLKEGNGLSLYSFRHGVADAFRRAGFLDEQFRFLLGHTQGTTTGRYGIMEHGVLEQRSKLIDAIDYPGLDLSHLYISGMRSQ